MTTFESQPNLLRKKESYEAGLNQIAANERRRLADTSFKGVIQKPFIASSGAETMKYLHPATNIFLDLMHTWAEGHAPYIIKCIFHHLVSKKYAR